MHCIYIATNLHTYEQEYIMLSTLFSINFQTDYGMAHAKIFLLMIMYYVFKIT